MTSAKKLNKKAENSDSLLATEMALLIIESGRGEKVLQLKDEDFPNVDVSFAHPDDYKLFKGALPAPEYIYHEGMGQHQRLIVRMPITVDENEYFVASFVVDTGAPTSFYLCDRFIDILSSRKMSIFYHELDT